VLGSGGQGETLEGLDTSTERQVAIKRFNVRGAASWKDVELAEREARVLQALEHPRLPRYIDHFEEEGALYLVMERVEGESLAAVRKRGGTLPRNEIVRMLADVGEVLDYLHGRAPPIIHRDIKPGNVIRRPDGTFVLVDFGSVRDSLKPEGGSTVVGTFGFMGPEQFQGRALPQSDVYALGATALSLLTGREPEELPHRGLAIDVVQSLPHDPTFARVLTRMLDPDPDRRADHVAPLVRELTPRPSAPPPYSPPHTWPPRSSRHGSHAPTSRRRYGQKPQRTRGPVARGGLIMLVVVLGILVARFSTGALFRVFLPVVLTLLSLFFGGGLRRAAEEMRRIGERGDEGLRHALDVVRGRTRRSERPDRHRRVRVEDWDDSDSGEFGYEDEDEDDHAHDGRRRWKRR
jgi:serine/threonine protein kinase